MSVSVAIDLKEGACQVVKIRPSGEIPIVFSGRLLAAKESLSYIFDRYDERWARYKVELYATEALTFVAVEYILDSDSYCMGKDSVRLYKYKVNVYVEGCPLGLIRQIGFSETSLGLFEDGGIEITNSLD